MDTELGAEGVAKTSYHRFNAYYLRTLLYSDYRQRSI